MPPILPPPLLPPPDAAIAATISETVRGVLPPGGLGAAIFFGLWLLGSVGVVWIFRTVLEAHAKASSSRVDDIIADALKVPLYVWLVLGGVWVEAVWFGVVPAPWVPVITAVTALAVALTAAYALVHIAMGVMSLHAERRPSFRAVQGTLEFALRLVVYAVALMLVLDHLGVEITPLLGALGIGGLAVALALQDTLANFFAGMYLNLDRPLREGDFVEVDGGALGTIKGFVVDVSWRSVRIRELANNVYVIPNSRVASGIIKNYDLPESEMSIVPQVSVAYGSDLERVEQVTIEVAREVLKRTAGGVDSFQPFIRYHTFGDSGIGFSVILRVRTFVDQYLVTHEFVKALHKRFAEEGIEIPFPQRTLHFAARNGEGPGPAELAHAPQGPAGRR